MNYDIEDCLLQAIIMTYPSYIEKKCAFNNNF